MAGTALSQEAILTVAEPTPPRIDAITEGPDGLIQLQVSGVPGHYAIDASSNLAGWMELTNFTTTAGSFQYVDAESNLLQRFYRVRLLP
jgi:hypothetical protein